MSILSDFSRYPASRFIETGTGKGETLMFASEAYPESVSIELDPGRYAQAVMKFGKRADIRLFNGHSPILLRYLIDPDVPTLFWLDAHYTDGEPGAIKSFGNCPLAKELAEIVRWEWKKPPMILIDDFSTFELGLHGWPKLSLLDEIMVGYRREKLDDSEVFTYVS
jgi:hypothetical protein